MVRNPSVNLRATLIIDEKVDHYICKAHKNLLYYFCPKLKDRPCKWA